MGCVCSCFSTVFMWTGELLQNVFLAVGEIGSILVRGIFAVLIGLCDVMAAISCCWRVPYDERPSRRTYTYGTMTADVGAKSVFANLTNKEARSASKQRNEEYKREFQAKLAAVKAEKAAASKSATKLGDKAKEATAGISQATSHAVEQTKEVLTPVSEALSTPPATKKAADEGWLAGWWGKPAK